jgi:tetratricopeptide (TPR) repeat protein
VDPDVSIFWVHASDAHRFREAYAHIAKACNIPGRNNRDADILLLVKKWLELQIKSPWLMIVDNADDKELFFPSQKQKDSPTMETQTTSENEGLVQYLPNCIHSRILFTTKLQQAGIMLSQGGSVIEVPKMTDSEAEQLLKASLPSEIFTAEASILSSRLENLPFALVQAASYIRRNRVSMHDYLKRLQDGDAAVVEYLSEEFDTVGRDSEAPRAVAATWIVSFQQIERNDKVASDLLSFLGVLHYEAIPITLIEHYYRSRCSNGNNNSTSSALLKALDLLRSFSFISEGTGQNIDMHRLVQLVLQKWLIAKNQMAKYVHRAMRVICGFFPIAYSGDFLKYLPHAHSALRKQVLDSERDYEARTSLLDQITSYLLENHIYLECLQGLVEQLLYTFRMRLGIEHPNTINQIMRLGTVYREQGRLKEAKDLYNQALELNLRVLGEDHPSTISNVHLLEALYWKKGEDRKAEELISSALARSAHSRARPWYHICEDERSFRTISISKSRSSYGQYRDGSSCRQCRDGSSCRQCRDGSSCRQCRDGNARRSKHHYN